MAVKKRQDFEIFSGDHKNLVYTVTNAQSASVDLTGNTIEWVLANHETSGSLLRLVTGGSGITISGCTFTVALSPAHTSGLAGDYYYEAQVTDTNSDVSTVSIGTATILTDLVGA